MKGPLKMNVLLNLPGKDLSNGPHLSYSQKSEQKHLFHSHFQEFSDQVILAVLQKTFEKYFLI